MTDTWPVKEILYGTYQWARRELGGYLGFGYDFGSWTALERGKVLSCLQSGAMQFYFPPPIGEGDNVSTHSWSFLTPVRTVFLSTGHASVALPFDFTGIIGDLTWQAGETTTIVPLVAETQLRQLQGNSPLSGPPKYAAVRPVHAPTLSKMGYEILLYPVPSADESGTELEYRSTVVPVSLQEDSDYTLPIFGAQQHAELYLASCLAIAEQRFKGGPGPCTAKFNEQLRAAVALDSSVMKPSEVGIWPLEDEPTSLVVDRAYLKRLIGRQMGFGPHHKAWNHKQASEVQVALDRGLRQFYDPVQVNDRWTHEWSFLRPLYGLSTVADQYTYQLPSDFAMLCGPVTFAVDQSVYYEQIEEVGLFRVRQWLQQGTGGRPRSVAVNSRMLEHNTGGVVWELWFAPIPDAAYELVVPYKANPLNLGEEASLTYGGQEHYETLIESCLAAAEALQEKKGQHYDRFLQLLGASISRDKKQLSPDTLGYNRDPSDRPMNPWWANHSCSDSYVTYNGEVVE